MTSFFKIAGFTVAQALVSTLIALTVGLAAAFLTGRRTFFWRRFLLSLSPVPFCLPSLLVALGYVTFFGMNGVLNRLLSSLTGNSEPALSFLYSFAGIVICHGFYNFPLVMSTVSSAWERLPDDEESAARLLGAGSFKVFRTITFFKLLPSIVSACIPVFLYCFFSFMIVLLFGTVGTTTLEVEIFEQAKVNLNFALALKMGAAETAIALIFVSLYTALEQKSRGVKGISFESELKEKPALCGSEKVFAFFVLALIFLFFICPFFSILYNALSSKRLASNFTPYNFAQLFRSSRFLNAVLWTFITAGLCGFLCAFLAFLYAVVLKSADRSGRFAVLRVIPVLPMAVSSVIVGIVLTLLVKKGNFLVLVLAQVFISWPVAFRQIYAAMQKIPQGTVDAAVILSRSPADVVFKLYLPVCRGAFLQATGFCFALSAGDATLPLVLALPRFDTLALYTYRLAGRYKFNEACAAGVILGLLCAVVFVLAKAAGKKSTSK